MPRSSKPTVRATAADVVRALRVRYAAPAFAMFEEVGNATGFGTNRHADAVAVGIWPSRGYEIEGIEVKVSRSDWTAELKNPAKADAIAKFCDRWWLAVGDEAIVHPGELPATWGLLVLRGDKLIAKTAAPKLKPEVTPRAFLAAILRRAHETIERQKSTAKLEGITLGEAKGPQDHARRHEAEVAGLQRAIAEQAKTIADFEKASGIKLNRWEAGEIGETVRELLELRRYGKPLAPVEELNRCANWIESTAASVRKEIDRLEKVAAIARNGQLALALEPEKASA